jgi:hypothetical protein
MRRGPLAKKSRGPDAAGAYRPYKTDTDLPPDQIEAGMRRPLRSLLGALERVRGLVSLALGWLEIALARRSHVAQVLALATVSFSLGH